MMKINILKKQNGFTLIIVLALLLMMTFVGMSMFSISDDDLSISANLQNSSRAFYSSEAGIALARAKLWNEYVNWASTNPQKLPGEIGNRDTYTQYLSEIGLADSSQVKLYSSYELGGGQMIDSVSVSREDIIGATLLSVVSAGSSLDGSKNTIQSDLVVEGEAFKGFEFAVLANNVNCIMCHATIDNVERVYNSDPAKEGTFDRVKIASLESMLIRTTSADSYVAGTVYTRGNVTDKTGNIITNLSPTGNGLGGYDISSTDGKIQEPLNYVSLSNTTGSPLPQYGNLYLNYPTETDEMTDGNLPETFPPPFSDENGNKIVDDPEFDELASNSSGGINGGILYGLSAGDTYTSSSLPGSGNMGSVSQSYDGNLILVGTDANPININGSVAINGDVIIQGKVQGTGQIFARGNVYITGDLTYNDGDSAGNRTFGVSSGGNRNALSVAAGKNILVGDYLTPKKGDILDKNVIDPGNLSGGEDFSFTQSEMTLFNRGEWTKTQAQLPDIDGNMVANATYDPTYQPRYYVMNDGDPVYIFNKNYTDKKGKSKGTYWDPSSNSWMGKEHTSKYDMSALTKLDPGDSELNGSTIISLSSTSDWISPQTLKELWIDDENNRNSGDEFKIDGQLYTNNS
ncbi:MAG: hypothetical protein ACE5D6_04805, partial [Candidatus Zixiibacteriota bacterium]